MNPIDRYLTALGGAIGGQIPSAERAARLREVRGHLQAAAQEVGMEEATRRFGPVSAVAGDLVRQSRGYPTRSTWALGAFVALAIALAYVVPGLITSYYSFTAWGNRFGLAGGILPPLALVGFAVRVGQTRRWLVLPVLPALGIAVASLFFLCVVHVPGPEKPLSRVLHDEVAYWQKHAEEVRQWRAGQTPAHVRPVWQADEHAKLLPFLMLPYRMERNGHVSIAPSWEADPAAWNRYGKAWEGYVEEQLRLAEAALRHPPTNYFEEVGFDWKRATGEWSEHIALGTLVLAATNALVLGATRRRDRRTSGPEWAR